MTAAGSWFLDIGFLWLRQVGHLSPVAAHGACHGGSLFSSSGEAWALGQAGKDALWPVGSS